MATDNFIKQSDSGQNKIQSPAARPFVIAIVICVLFSGCFVISSLAGLGLSREIELDEQINPNDAPAASLVRLPGIGIGRARAIVAYRENFSEKNHGRAVFRNCDDLQKVRGIGPKTAQNISQWLKFE
jgi:competence ComEA-like helix-hairpin-helix protein